METISNKEGFTLVICFILCNCFSYLYGGGDWVSYIFASILAILIWWLLSSVMEKHGFKSFFEMLTFAFGKIPGKIIAFILMIYALLSSTTTITVFGKFTQMTSLPKTPQIILPLLILILAALSLRSGLRILSHGATLLFYFAILTLISFAVFSFPQLDVRNILPIADNGFLPILKNSLSVFTNQFGDIIILLCIYPHIKGNLRKKHLLWAVISACAIVSLIALFTIMILGREQTATEFFPVFTTLSIRGIGAYIQHMEILTSIALTFFVFIRQVINLYFVTLAVSHIFKTKSYKPYLIPSAIIVSVLTLILYPSIISLTYRVESDLNLYILLPLQLVLPTVLGAILVFKSKKEK